MFGFPDHGDLKNGFNMLPTIGYLAGPSGKFEGLEVFLCHQMTKSPRTIVKSPNHILTSLHCDSKHFSNRSTYVRTMQCALYSFLSVCANNFFCCQALCD